MTLPVNYRKTVVDAVVALLESVEIGSEYATTLKTVGRGLNALTASDATDCPAVGVYVKSTRQEAIVGRRYQRQFDLYIHGIVRPDIHLWEGLDLTEVAALVMTDVEKALDQDSTRGVDAVFQFRDSDLSVDLEKDFAVFTIQETFEFKTPC